MSLDMQIAAIGGDRVNLQRFLSQRSSEIRPPQWNLPSASVREDGVVLSDSAKAAAQEPEPDPYLKELEDKYLAALEEFTKYALELNGIHRDPTGQDGWNALKILAEKSGVEMPLNINEGKYKLMAAFQEAWGLSEDPSVEEISEKMTRVFGKDRSWYKSPPLSTGTGSGPMEGAPVQDKMSAVEERRPPAEDRLSAASDRIRSELLAENRAEISFLG